METQPLISIAITTFNRIDFLKDLIKCLLTQDSDHIEILIGNDYTKHTLKHTDLELPVDFKNVKIFNHPENLGEYENLIYLFKKSTGKYFTWQFDDDFYSFDYLSKMKSSIEKYNPDCVYCNFGFLYGKERLVNKNNNTHQIKEYTGKSFIVDYCNRKVNTMGLTGMYKKTFIEDIGFLPLATEGKYALYSEYLLLINSVKLNSIIYHEEKLIFNRIHSGSFSFESSDSVYFYNAGKGFLKLANDILKNKNKNLKKKVIKFFLISVIKTNFTKSNFKDMKKAYNSSILNLYQTKDLTTKFERLVIFLKFPLYALKSILYPRKYFSYFHKIKNNSFLKNFIEPNF